jgi:hypothetical protein
MAALTVREASLAGVSLGGMTAGASGGDSFVNNGLVILVLANSSGGAITVTADAPGAPALEGAIATNNDSQKVVAAGALRDVWGPFPAWRFNDAAGAVQLTYSANPPTGLTLEPVRIRN